jgi:hypothetical protein
MVPHTVAAAIADAISANIRKRFVAVIMDFLKSVFAF